jgi:hypothetical protein
MVLGLLPLLGAEFLPAEIRLQFMSWAATLDPVLWVSSSLVVLLGLDVVLVVIASRRFRRSQLVLD